MGGFFSGIKNYLKFSSKKRTATLSGALTFYAALGIVPIAYLATLVLSVLGTELKDAVAPFLYPELAGVADYVIKTAEKLGGGNVVAFMVALYSSGNLFFHLKASGEMIYGYPYESSFAGRVASSAATFFGVCAFSVLSCAYLAVVPVVKARFGSLISGVLSIVTAFFTIFAAAALLNFYACPFKLKFNEIAKGSLFTATFSLAASFAFFVYIDNFADYSEIYGAIATIIVFLSWLYLMVKGFTEGMVLNAYFSGRINIRRRKGLQKII